MTGRPLRLVNFLLDTSIYLLFTISFVFIFRNTIDKNNIKWISIVFYILYYFLFEYFTGQTLGKMITRSKVVQLSKSDDFYFIQILGRTLIRLIPIDILSYLFSSRGIHDWISKTDVKKLIKPGV